MESLAVVIIRNNRRLLDHEALIRTQDFDRYLILLTPPPQWNIPGRISEKRKAHIQSSMNAFALGLGEVPVHYSENPREVLEKLKHFKLNVLVEAQGAQEEERALKDLGEVTLIRTRPNTIFIAPKLYPTFTPFRSNLEKEQGPSTFLARAELDPSRGVRLTDYLYQRFDVPDSSWAGEKNALKRVLSYLENHLEEYPVTRNYLEDPQASSKFSYYLSSGELSARWLYQEIQKRSPGNWLGVELIWREFFWQHGVQFNLPSKGSMIVDWENKITHPLARAITNELRETGYISNRSRQILASYLIYELGLDWKIGAAFFEAHLFDYDVFVNWGNWQYIAGVKFDPRGGRKFNLDLQVEKYDPTGSYQKKWNS
jgi:deoxyribodipyrimidine photolyase